MTVNSDIVDALTRHRVYLLRYEAGAVRRAQDAYSTALRDVEQSLQRLERDADEGLSSAQRARLLGLQAQLDTAMRAAQEAVREQIRDDLEGAALAEARIVASQVGGALPPALRVSFVSVPEQMVLTLLQQDIPRWDQALQLSLFTGRQALQGALASAAAQGASNDAIVKALRDGLGMVDRQRNDIRRLVRTEMQKAANDVALETYARNRDVIKAVQYLATLDTRVCPVCGPFHNQVYNLTDSGGLPVDAPRIPRHPNCRCFYAPVTKSWEELGFPIPERQRQRMDGEADSVTDFEGWLRRQSEADQRKVLETEWRYQAWASGAPITAFSTGDEVFTREEYEARVAA